MAQVIALDTNVVVRFLARDDEAQFRKADALLARSRVLLSATVLLEAEWVLSYSYDFDKAEIAAGLALLRGLPNVVFLEQEVCERAINLHRAGLDFADAMHVSCAHQAESFATFDRALIKKAARLATPVKVVPA